MAKYTPSQNRASQRYADKNLEQIAIRVHKGQKDYYKSAADQAGLSFAQFITTAMDEKIERDNLHPETTTEKIE